MTKEKLKQAQDILIDIEYLKNIQISDGIYSGCGKNPIEPTKEIMDFAFKVHNNRADSLRKSIKSKITDLEKQFAKL